MATREKKARSVTADSPTPSLGSAHGGSGSYLNSGGSTTTLVTGSTTTATTGNALTLTTVGGSGGGGSVSAPTTPTSTRKRLASTGNASNNSTGGGGNSGLGSSASSASVGSISSTRGSLSRLKSKQLLQTAAGASDETVHEDTPTTGDGGGSLLAVVSTTPRTTRGGTLREESSPSSGDVSSTSVGPTSSLERGEDRTQAAAAAGSSSAGGGGSLLKDQTKSPAIGARRAAAAIAAKKFTGGASPAAAIGGATSTTSTRATTDRKHRRGLALKRTTLLKRKGKKIIVKPVLGRKGGVARRALVAAVATKVTAGPSAMRGATGVKKDPAPSTVRSEEALTEQRTATPSLRNGKPRNSDSPVPKRKAATGGKPEPQVHKSPDSSSGAVTATRAGDTIRQAEPMAEDGGDHDGDDATAASAVVVAPSLDIKRELIDADTKTKSFVLDKMSETFNERKGVVSPVVSEKGGNTLLRRSMRQRKSTARDKEDFVSPRQKPPGAATIVIKVEPTERCDSAMGEPLEAVADRQSPVAVPAVAPADRPLTIDTTDERRVVAPKDGAVADDSVTSTPCGGEDVPPEATATVASGTTVVELVEEKDTSSLSPELVSEGVSELSVKECYGEPAFLENNLGIEKDPKLGEIVQERFWYDKVSGDEVSSGGACEEGAEVEEEVDAKREQELPMDRKDPEKETEEREQGKEKAHEEQEEGSEEKEDKMIVDLAPEDLDEHDDVVEVQVAAHDDDPMIIDDDQPIAVVVVEEHSNGGDDQEVVVTKNSDVMEQDHDLDAGGVSEPNEDQPQPDEAAMDPIPNGPAVTVQRSSSPSVAEEEDVAIVDVPSPVMVASSKTETVEDVAASPSAPARVADTTTTTTPPVVVIDDGEDDDDDVTDKSDQEAGGSGDTKTENVSKTATQPGSSGDKHHRGGSQSPRANGDSSGSEKSCSSSSGHQTGAAAAASAARTGGAKASATPGAAAPPKAKAGGTPQGSHGNGKGAKGGRTAKEKPKEDERTREEKLRQEKLRVEEKVREEKRRAERLEAEKRLLLHERKPVENGALVVEDGRASNAGSHPSSPISGDGEGERKPEGDSPTPVPAAATLISLGALNLPAITIVKKDNNEATPTTVKDEDKEPAATQKPKAAAKLEIVPLKKESSASPSPPPTIGPAAKDEKPTKPDTTKGSGDSVESPLQIISKSEAAAAAVTVTKTLNGSGNNSSGGGASDEDPKELLTGGSSSRKRTPEVVAQLPAEPAATSPSAAGLLEESDDVAKQKESHLKHLGLLTIRAACEEKQRRAEQKPAAPAPVSTSPSAADMMRDDGHTVAGRDGWLAAAISQSAAGSGSGGGGRSGNKSTRSSKDEYTVSMKTVLMKGGSGGARGSEKRKQQRMPLKMTFQKGKGKGSGGGGSGATRRNSSHGGGSGSNSSGFSGTANHHVSNGGSGSASGYVTDGGPNNGGGQDFYTIHSNEADHHSSNSSDGHTHRGEGGRKSHSRSHTTDGVGPADAVSGEPSSSKEAIQTSLVIPEKASSFNVHPERLCQDQCFYCGGKFGLFDTPCHIAALKSTERQQKILLVESKISLDSCLCDACFRHVDRKANCPSQKKKVTTATAATTPASSSSTSGATGPASQTTVSPIVIKVTTNKDGSTSIAGQQQQQQQQHPPHSVIDDGSGGKVRENCAVRQCTANTVQSLRRKWVLKMKRKICKHLDINLEQATKATAESIFICNKHYEQIGHLMICAMCTKPLQRNHVYHVYNNISQLERLIQEQGIPGLRLSSSELVVCKLCKYYANLLLKPPDAKSQKAQFIKSYNRRLYNTRNRNSESQEEEVEMVQHVDPSFALMNASACAAARQPATVDIVISDGDDEEAEDEEEDVRECPSQPVVDHQTFQSVSDLFSIGDSSVSLQRRVNSRKSPDVSIVENNGATQMGDLGEITITPTTKSLSSATGCINQHQAPPSAPRDDDNIDMTKVLKSNPNISMRELFPGEEELGIHVNIPFSSSSTRTPEGWTKATATIQYDDSTRALWEELQEPYGNQSSFLRHLILLERYFRNGELVLSPQAKTSATSYAEAMQNRLRSYDNKPTPSSPPALASLTPSTSVVLPVQLDKATNIMQQFSNATITIVPASRVRPKATATSAAGGPSVVDGSSTAAPISLLKSNNLHLSSGGSSSDHHTAASSLKRKLSNESKSLAPPPSLAAVVTPMPVAKVAKLDDPSKLSPSSMPPELISINRKPNVTITTIPVARFAPLPPQQQSLLQPTSSQSLLQQQPAQPQALVPAVSHIASKQSPPVAGTADGSSAAAKEIIQMPDQLTEAERRKSSPPWRPTLLPIAPGVTESLKAGPQYKTADGRLLPKLVQVMSGGKPYHISINDYNRMCILRREKLFQQQQNLLLSGNKRPGLQQPQPQPTTKHASSSISPSALPSLRLSTTISDGTATTVSQPVATAKMVQIPNQIFEQNSLIPIIGTTSAGGTTKLGTTAGSHKSSSLTVTMTTTTSASNNNNINSLTKMNSAAPKPLSLPNSTTVYPMTITANTITLPSAAYSAASGVATSSPVSNSSVTSSLMLTSTPSPSLMSSGSSNVQLTLNSGTAAPVATSNNPIEQLLKSGNLVSQAQLHAFVAAAAAAGMAGTTGLGSSSTTIDNSAAQLLSKIPKSLTVIPQQKQRSMSRVSSNEDQNSA
ncbi:uncharacterized protein LOC128269773 [Anopheles cruzii]|uniref:uncharacterized protein LOC128269773 n=1 Tax=Anopheles cruzii TaxID=68878 RepID=UPI0022EC3E5A|nr:uncharacterized protein LOC128269773 [Anopheles cruzii]